MDLPVTECAWCKHLIIEVHSVIALDTSFDLLSGEEKKEPQKSDEEPCERCEDVNKEGKKKVPVISSFRREKGRMGNITIDSKSLRSGFGGPGYAAPVARKLIEQRPEPKSFKVRKSVTAEWIIIIVFKYVASSTCKKFNS